MKINQECDGEYTKSKRHKREEQVSLGLVHGRPVRRKERERIKYAARATNLPKGEVLKLYDGVRNTIGPTVQVLPPLHELHRVRVQVPHIRPGCPDLLRPPDPQGGRPSGSS